MTDFSTLWGSPNAVAFKETCLPVGEAVCEFYDEMRMIAQNAVDAYNFMASSLGEGLINEQYYSPGGASLGFDYAKLFEHNNHIRGMNVNLVKNHILPIFESNIQRVYESLNEVPVSIALYDNENAQTGAYATGIENMKIRLESLMNQMKTSIRNAIETEADNMLLAKTQSTNALNG